MVLTGRFFDESFASGILIRRDDDDSFLFLFNVDCDAGGRLAFVVSPNTTPTALERVNRPVRLERDAIVWCHLLFL